MSIRSEDEYFHAKEAQRRRQLREEYERKAAAEQAKRKLADGLQIDDQAVIDRLHGLGLDGEVAEVLHLLPLVQIAWADGSVSARERAAIMQAVEAHGVAPGTPAATFIASLLETRPADSLLDEILSVLKEILAARGLRPESLMDACEGVASASGGLLGFGDKISEEEREAIRKISESLGKNWSAG